MRWGAPRQGLPTCLGLSELQQLKDHPDKACVSWWCVHGPLFPFTAHNLQRTSLSFHCTQPHFTVHYSTIDNVVGLLSRFEKGAMMAKVDLKSAFRMVPIQASEWSSEWFQSMQASDWSSNSKAWIGTILNADFEEASPPYPS